MIDDAPGHFCLEHERAELATWIYLALLGDWDAVLIPELDYARVTFGHYRFMDCFAETQDPIDELRAILIAAEPEVT